MAGLGQVFWATGSRCLSVQSMEEIEILTSIPISRPLKYFFSWNSCWKLLHNLLPLVFRNYLVTHSPNLIYSLHSSVVSFYLHFVVQSYLIYLLLFMTSNLEKPCNHLMIISYADLKCRGEKKQFNSSMCTLITVVQGTLPFEEVGYY